MLQIAVSVAATLVSLAFALSTFERWLARRRRHELAWSVALAMFCIAAGALAAGAGLGWNALIFRVFYLFGAILNVPFLALGTIYLLAGQRRGDWWAAGISLGGAFAAGVLAVAPLTGPIPSDELVRGSEVFGPLPRVLAAVASSAGAFVVWGGAVWSAIRQRTARAVLSNGLIASGTVVLAASGLLNSVLGEMVGFAVTLLAGISLLFAGFLIAVASPRRLATAAAVGDEEAAAAPARHAGAPGRETAPPSAASRVS